MNNLSVIFLFKIPFTGDFPLPCLTTRGQATNFSNGNRSSEGLNDEWLPESSLSDEKSGQKIHLEGMLFGGLDSHSWVCPDKRFTQNWTFPRMKDLKMMLHRDKPSERLRFSRSGLGGWRWFAGPKSSSSWTPLLLLESAHFVSSYLMT